MKIYRFAGLNIGIEASEYTYEKCRGYESADTTPDFTVAVTDEQVKREQDISQNVSFEYCEFICIYRAICSIIPLYNRLLLHSAVIEKDGYAYAFAAKSGTGKTTHVNLWKKLYGDRVRMINGDKPLLRFDGSTVYACGTPWCGKEGYGSNREAPLRAICFIERAENNSITELSGDEAVSLVMKQVFIPKFGESAVKTLELCSALLENVKAYKLYCNMDTDAARVACEKMSANS